MFDISTFLGLPAHPLFVHIPVVLVPLGAIGAVAMAVSAWVRRRFGWLVAGITVVAGIGTQLAISSGQGLRGSVVPSAALARHISIAESIRPLVLVLFFAILALLWVDWRTASGTPPARWILAAASVVEVLAAVGSTVRLAQIGHTGAQAAWQKVHLGRSQSGRLGH